MRQLFLTEDPEIEQFLDVHLKFSFRLVLFWLAATAASHISWNSPSVL